MRKNTECIKVTRSSWKKMYKKWEKREKNFKQKLEVILGVTVE